MVTCKIIESLSDPPVVMLDGVRQTSKSTLAESLMKKNRDTPQIFRAEFRCTGGK